MDKNNIWSIFERTGSINAYITYKQKEHQETSATSSEEDTEKAETSVTG